MTYSLLCTISILLLCTSVSLVPVGVKGQDYTVRREIQQVKSLIQSRPDSAYLKAKMLYSEAIETEKWEVAGEASQVMGKIAFHMGSYPQAFEHYHEALKIYSHPINTKKQAEVYHGLGLLYYHNRQINKSFEVYRKAILFYDRLEEKGGLAEIYGKIGHLFEKQAQYDSAFFYQEKALKIFQDIGDQRGLAKIHENLGSIYEDQQKYPEAQFHFERADQLYIEVADNLSRIEVINNMGDIYRKTGYYQQALSATKQALKLAIEFQELYQMESAYRDLGKVHQLMGSYDSAYFYLEASRDVARRLYSTESSQEIAFLQVLFDLEAKEDRIQELHYIRRTIVIVAAAGIVIAVLLFSFFYFKTRSERRLKIKENHLLDAQNQLISAELRHKELTARNLAQELEARSRELSGNTLYLIQKNQFLESLKGELQDLLKEDRRDNKKLLKKIIVQIDQSFSNDKYWEDFRTAFEQVHGDFYEKLSHRSPDLKANDFRLVALLKMNFTTEEIAALLGISVDSVRVARYRLRKKLHLDQRENLVTFLQNI